MDSRTFWIRVSPDASGCWLWTRGTSRGYGQLHVEHGRRAYAHRIAYELVRGPVPEGLQLDHLCRIPRCVNPDHLEPVTPRENTLRGQGLAARFAARDRCANGHAFNPVNTYYRADRRECRVCKRNWDRRQMNRAKAGPA